MKRIMKGNKTHIVTFCPTCTTGDPWIIYGEEDYTLNRSNMTKEFKPITEQRKQKMTEGWLKHPEKIPFYRGSWSMGDLYDKPLDWSMEQAR
jgi:exopolysaccharide biosynthesis predicted pyruvyltransferase EpsI